MDWHSNHVYYYESNKDALILEGVRPLFRRLVGQVSAVSFTRHWKFGPHLRLNVRTDANTFAEVVRPAVDEVIGGFLARCPSTRRLDPERELPVHQRLAELENEKGPLLPWYPDNSIRVAPYDRREEALYNEQMFDLLMDFYASTTEFAFRMIEEVSGRDRLAMSFNLMIATAHALSGRNVTGAFVSFRSHAEGFLCGFPEGDGLRSAWEDHYGKNVNALVDRVRAVTATLDEGRPIIPFVQDWVAVVAPFRERAIQLAMDGALLMRSGAPSDDLIGETILGDFSPFHRRLFANPRWRETKSSPSFLAYRLMLNCTYLLMTRIGVVPAERLLLCHLAANAVEDCYGISAFELIDGSRGARR